MQFPFSGDKVIDLDELSRIENFDLKSFEKLYKRHLKYPSALFCNFVSQVYKDRHGYPPETTRSLRECRLVPHWREVTVGLKRNIRVEREALHVLHTLDCITSGTSTGVQRACDILIQRYKTLISVINSGDKGEQATFQKCQRSELIQTGVAGHLLGEKEK